MPKCTKMILERFKKLGITVKLNSFITKAEKNSITLNKEEKIDSDILIWTGGVKVCPVVSEFLGSKETRGAIKVNKYLQSEKDTCIFAAGDNAYFEDPKNPGRSLPWLALIAITQGEIIAKNIIASIEGDKIRPYKPAKDIMVLPIGGKFAIFKFGNKIFKGTWCWYLRRLISLKYSLSILPFFRALQKWQHGNNVFSDND